VLEKKRGFLASGYICATETEFLMGSQSLLRHDIFIGKIIYATCGYCANDLILGSYAL
jgi:hypothetical protein